MLDFPASPTVGQQFIAAGVTWTWDGTKWTAAGLSVAYLPLAGGQMSGPILLAADPTVALGAATKQYVDTRPSGIGENRILNGDMRIDQRNNGASGTATGYTADRWIYNGSQASKGTWQRSPGALSASGFTYWLAFTSSSAYTPLAADSFVFAQSIEADMVSDFSFGAAAAQSIALSFWIASSLTGQFGGSIRNYAGTRSYPFSFSLPVANTWTRIAIVIPGDTTGTWVMFGNAGALIVSFDLGAGANFRAAAGAWVAGNITGATGDVNVVATNGATISLTGVKLEVGSVATPYPRQSLAKSMADCQRYYQRIGGSASTDFFVQCYQVAGQNLATTLTIQQMRAAPTVTAPSIVLVNANNLNFAAGVSSVSIYANTIALGTVGMVTGPIILSAEL